MSVKKKDVAFKYFEEENGDTRIEAALILQNRQVITALEKSLVRTPLGIRSLILDRQDVIAKSIMYHVYGDLIGPLNEMAILAQHHLTGMNDADELRELKKKLNDILKGC